MGLSKGLVQIYTGDGKGKTSAALGLALRAVGQGLRVCFVQLMKGQIASGERAAAERLAPDLELRVFGAEKWGDADKAPAGAPWWQLPPSDEDRAQARRGLDFARRALTGEGCDIVVVDEIFGAVGAGLISLEEVRELIEGKPERVELVLTGRAAPAEIVEAADLVTEMKAVKHPYQQGIGARKGIEF